MKNEFIGIDISKVTFDACCYFKKTHSVFSNDLSGFKDFVLWVESFDLKLKNVLFCMENTGIYSVELPSFLNSIKCKYVVESAIQIKRSIGLRRGKNDKVDAFRIAEYAYLHKDKLLPVKPEMEEIICIKKLLTHRDRMVEHRKVYRDNIKEYKRIFKSEKFKELYTSQESIIREFDNQIKQIEAQIKEIITSNTELEKKFNLIESIKGVGLILGCYLIVSTSNFTRFDDPRKFACYSGIAPFQYTSGTSISFKTKVNNMADKKIKSLLNLAARCAICHDPELKKYYLRKVEEGKNKMSVLNSVRNKIVHRVFAVIKRESPYVVLGNY